MALERCAGPFSNPRRRGAAHRVNFQGASGAPVRRCRYRPMPPRVGAKSFEPPCAAAVKRKGAAVKRALTPGTFDPITAGHLDVISRAAQLVDEVIVARGCLCEEKAALLPRGASGPCEGGHARFAQRARRAFRRAARRLRPPHGRPGRGEGIARITDFEYEFQMTALNYQLDNELETLFIMSTPQHMYLSSSIVREIALSAGMCPVRGRPA